ncbi:M56 family metallopeptidase [Actinomadura barringtoniae]|uniref:M56 family metallopeptidase n=1 Tax=Actinomadura barringtoniae TaxID=1427535 RepID=A0A939PQA9_9ACTN|nr:M56 family metallopeptidase [Actinomadura barringtoniae]MBO2453229.1 M56 family metallopeptidase [Actinomadura barringtoniae]
MDLDQYVPLVAPVSAALAARPLAWRLPPRAATWLLTAGAAIMGLATVCCLVLLTSGGLLHISWIAALADMAPGELPRSPETNVPMATVAGVLLVVSLAMATRAALVQVRGLRSSARAARNLPGRDVVAIVEDDQVDAYALPGRPGRVVVSTGMLELLTPIEQGALLAHERSHLSARHHLFRGVTAVAVAANPLLWPLRDAVVFSTERWADEFAARTIGDRTHLARAIGKASLAGPSGRLAEGAGGMSIIGGTRRPRLRRDPRPGPVPRRVMALMRPRRVRRSAIFLALLTIAVPTFTATQQVGEAAQELHGQVEFAQEQAPTR